ncbi:predicted protein [Chaetoceros tenuissimus]|uniref:Uncharacterized protein n=1 Tax=Chaetoceros tenuissimus TaxID=426638 RepID=A0AAD3CJF0_9STRA|nr:predicted protein [Chaetoceros tenuissimus]
MLKKPTKDTLKLLLDVGKKDLLLSRDIDGATPFHIALEFADNHRPRVLRVFVEAGDMELFITKDNQGRTPISLVKGLESREKYKSQEWKDFFVHFYKKAYKELLLEMDEISEFEFPNERDIASLQNEVLKLLNKNLNKNTKLDAEAIVLLETKVKKLESEKSNQIKNIKKLEDKKNSDAKVIESLKTEIKAMVAEKENDKDNHKNAIEAVHTENIKAKETIKALQAKQDSHTNFITSLQADKKSDAKVIEALQVENEKAKESLQSLQAEKKSHANLIHALKTEKEKIDIEKDDIRKELDTSIISEYEKDKIIESLKSENSNLREDITNMQFNLELEQEEIQDHHASKMKGLKRKIEKLVSTSKEEANDAKAKRSRFFFWQLLSRPRI